MREERGPSVLSSVVAELAAAIHDFLRVFNFVTRRSESCLVGNTSCMSVHLLNDRAWKRRCCGATAVTIASRYYVLDSS